MKNWQLNRLVQASRSRTSLWSEFDSRREIFSRRREGSLGSCTLDSMPTPSRKLQNSAEHENKYFHNYVKVRWLSADKASSKCARQWEFMEIESLACRVLDRITTH